MAMDPINMHKNKDGQQILQILSKNIYFQFDQCCIVDVILVFLVAEGVAAEVTSKVKFGINFLLQVGNLSIQTWI